MKRIDLSKEWKAIKLDILEFENDIDESLLTEDLFQIRNEEYIIDSGWYSTQNSFITYLIFQSNWSDPIITIKSENIFDCLNAIQLVIYYADKLIVRNNG
jgi:hypothetical protein